jgi:hypothetical protein
MAQKANIDILFDILCDFPSLSILKNNVNILEEVLNIIGSFDINNSIGNESDTGTLLLLHTCTCHVTGTKIMTCPNHNHCMLLLGLLMTGRCSPVDCIHWCTLFVKRCIKSIHQLASGDLACAIPEYQLSESRTTSLAMQMVCTLNSPSQCALLLTFITGESSIIDASSENISKVK